MLFSKYNDLLCSDLGIKLTAPSKTSLIFFLSHVFRSDGHYQVSPPHHVLPIPDVHPKWLPGGPFLGQLLDQSRGGTSSCSSQYHHSSNNQLHAWLREHKHATRVLPQVHRLLFSRLVCVHLHDTSRVRTGTEKVPKKNLRPRQQEDGR